MDPPPAAAVDIEARRQLSALLEHVHAGGITNREFEDRWEEYRRSRGWVAPAEVPDLGVREIIHWTWFLYSDIGREEIKVLEKDLPALERILLFLKSELPYQWPESDFGLHVIAGNIRAAISTVVRGMLGAEKRPGPYDQLEEKAWPFPSVQSYERAKSDQAALT